jgi:hypothetical protein
MFRNIDGRIFRPAFIGYGYIKIAVINPHCIGRNIHHAPQSDCKNNSNPFRHAARIPSRQTGNELKKTIVLQILLIQQPLPSCQNIFAKKPK